MKYVVHSCNAPGSSAVGSRYVATATPSALLPRGSDTQMTAG
jgi:hypothetical protein